MKTVVIGLDGATLDVIQPLVDAGRMPNIKSIMQNGCYGHLRSSYPWITPPAWTTFYTGRNPGKHGIYGFLKFNPDPSKKIIELTNFSDIKCATIWDLFKKQGKKCLLVNLPLTYPAPEVHGISISGMGTPNLESDFAYPLKIKDELRRRFPELTYLNAPTTVSERGIEPFLRQIIIQEGIRRDATLHYYGKDEFDLTMVVFQITDSVAHKSWNLLANTDQLEKLGMEQQPVHTAYEQADKFVGELMESMGPDVNYLLMSDHGFGSKHRNFNCNKWLLENGYIKLKQRSALNFYKNYPFVIKTKSIQWILLKMGLFGKLKKFLPARILNLKIPMPAPSNDWHGLIDWEKTTAYQANYGIYLNLKGREVTGIVEPGAQAESLVKELSEKLLELVDHEKGEQIAQEVLSNRELYSGEFAKFGWDLAATLPDEYGFHSRFSNAPIFSDLNYGTHLQEGIIFAIGPAFKKGFEVEGANIQDVMPTILALNNIPIPDEVDGRVLNEIIKDDHLSKLKIEYTDTDEEIDHGSGRVYSDEESELIKENLRDLGYL